MKHSHGFLEVLFRLVFFLVSTGSSSPFLSGSASPFQDRPGPGDVCLHSPRAEEFLCAQRRNLFGDSPIDQLI